MFIDVILMLGQQREAAWRTEAQACTVTLYNDALSTNSVDSVTKIHHELNSMERNPPSEAGS